MSTGNAAATLSLGIRTGPALAELAALAAGLTKFKGALQEFNGLKAADPLAGLSAHSQQEVSGLRNQLQQMSRTHETAMKEMEEKLKASTARREKIEGESLQKRIGQQRQYEAYTRRGHSGDTETVAKAAALIGPTRAEYENGLAARIAFSATAAAESAKLTRVMQTDQLKQAALIGPTRAMYEKAIADRIAFSATAAAENATLTRVMQIDQLKQAALIGPTRAMYEKHLESQRKLHDGAAEGAHRHTEAQKMLHSATRGVSGALGALWLTYGSHVPAMLAGFAAIATIRDSIKKGMEFDYTTSFTTALEDRTHQGGSQAYKEKLQADILEVAKTTQYSGNELAKGLRVLEQTGIDAAKGIGLIKTASQAALMGEVDLKTATEDLVAVMSVFKLRSEDPLTLQKNFQRVGDVMATVSKETQANLHDVAESLKQVTGMAGQYKVSLETAAAVIAQLGKAGIVGSRAGTFSRNMFENLYAEGSTEAREVKKALAITPFAADGSYKKDIDYLKEAFDKIRAINTEKERGIAISAIFNERGGKPARELLTAFEGMGAALDKINNSQGSLASFAKNLEGVAKVEWQTVSARWDDMLTKMLKGSDKTLVSLAKQLQVTFSDPDILSGLQSMMKITMGIASGVALIAEGWAKIFALFGKGSGGFQGDLANTGGEQKAYLEKQLQKLKEQGRGANDPLVKSLQASLDQAQKGKAAAEYAATYARNATTEAEGVARANAALAARRATGPNTEGKTGVSLPLSVTDNTAFREQQRIVKLKADAAVKEFTAAEKLAQQQYTMEAGLLDRAYAKKLVTEEEYLASRKGLDELYMFDVATAEYETTRRVLKAKKTLESAAVREQLDIALKGVNDFRIARDQAHEADRVKRLREAEQDAREAANTILNKEGPALTAKADFDTGKLLKQSSARHLSTGDRAEAEAALRSEEIFQSAISATNNKIEEAIKIYGKNSDAVRELTRAKDDLTIRMGVAGDEAKRVARVIDDAQRSFKSGWTDATAAATRANEDYASHAKSIHSALSNSITNSLVNSSKSYRDFIEQGKSGWVSFRDTAVNALRDVTKAVLDQIVQIQARKLAANIVDGGSTLLGDGVKAVKNFLTPDANAKGGVYSSADLHSYANTIVSSPTLFRFAQGGAFRDGLMGEKPGSPGEAIMPLARMSGGDLGVKVSGNAPPSITVVQNINIDSRTDQAVIGMSMAQAQRNAVAAIASAQRRGG